MTFYGKHGYSFAQQSGTYGQDISNDNHDSGLQNGWTYTSQLTVEAGMYVLHAHYSPAQGSGDFPGGDEDQYSIGVSKNGSVRFPYDWKRSFSCNTFKSRFKNVGFSRNIFLHTKTLRQAG